jgi:deoxyribonuclease-4
VFISTFPRVWIEQLFFVSLLNPYSAGCGLVKVGVHVSISGTIDQAVDRARGLACDTFQIFTRNPRGWKYKKLEGEEVEEFKRKLASDGLSPVVAHMPYLPNLSSPKKMVYNRSVKSLSAELDRCCMLGIPYLVTHLGSHMGKGQDLGLDRITEAINSAVAENPNDVMLLLENTAGTKNSMGSFLDDLKKILKRIEDRRRVGICLDTAHAYAAGYDLHSPRGVDETLARFDSVLGFEMLKVIHLNDSKAGLGSGRDIHEHIGMGYIGEKGFRAFLRHGIVRNSPLILETPIDDRGDQSDDLRKVRELSA